METECCEETLNVEDVRARNVKNHALRVAIHALKTFKSSLRHVDSLDRIDELFQKYVQEILGLSEDIHHMKNVGVPPQRRATTIRKQGKQEIPKQFRDELNLRVPNPQGVIDTCGQTLRDLDKAESALKKCGPMQGNSGNRSVLSIPTVKKVDEEASLDVEKAEGKGLSTKNVKVMASKSATIGIGGGVIQVYHYKIEFPKDAVPEDTKFELSIDNDPLNYPKEKFPVAPILNVEPFMCFEKDVTVTVHTWFTAAEGEKLDAQVLQRKRDGDWEEEQELVLSDKNEVKFDVRHFSGRMVVSKKKRDKKTSGNFYLFNSVYLDKLTKGIISVFSKEERTLEEAESKFSEERYWKVLVPVHELKGKNCSSFQVKVDCQEPKNVVYSYKNEQRAPATFKVSEVLDKKWIARYFRATNLPEQRNEPFVVDYYVVETGVEDNELYAVLSSPGKSNPPPAKNDGVSVNVTFNMTDANNKTTTNKTINAFKVADNGGKFSSKEYSPKSQLFAEEPQTSKGARRQKFQGGSSK